MTTLDPRILSTSLPPDMADIVEKMARNVDQHVDAILVRFRNDLAAKIKAVADGRWDAELQRDLDSIHQEVSKDLTTALAASDNLRRAAEEVRQLAIQSNDNKIAEAVGKMTSETAKLEQSLADLRGKITNVSAKVGKVVGQAAAKAVGI